MRGPRRFSVLTGVLAAAAALLAGCSAPAASPAAPGTPGVTTNAPPPTPMPTGPDGRPFVIAEVAAFDEPWALAFLPGTDRLLISQRGGRLLLRDQATGTITTVQGTPEVVAEGQGGLGDIVPGPSFARDQTVYLSWAEAGPAGTAGAAVGRARLEVGDGTASLADLKVIWRQQPKVDGRGHYGHRLAFSPDGQYLFVSSGERQKFDPAQDLDSALGKVLRLTPDGEPAAGNPFAERGGVSAEIWSYGHRNPLGLAFDAHGNLWESEMGPQGGDEINLIQPGRNYGWPEASNGSHYGGADIPDHTTGDGFVPPQVWWTPSISPGSLMIYTGSLFPQWHGDAFVGALSGRALIRVDLDGATAAKADQWDLGQRIREVEQGPDGSLWLLEDAPTGRLLHLTPAS